MRRLTPLLAALLLLAGCGGPALHGGRPHSAPHFGAPPHGDFGLSGRQLLAVPQIQGYDAVTLANVPGSTQAVGCYASGRYANCSEAQRRFPHAHLVTIATYAGAAARCLDTEPGDSTPPQVPGWIRWMLSRGVRLPCDYADSSEIGTVRAYLDHAGIPRASYTLWLADWDGNPNIPPGFGAKQWFSNCCVDRDSFATWFFSAPPKPKPRLRCFGPHRSNASACQKLRSEVASWTRARDSSGRAYKVRGCDVLAQRTRWFAGRLSAHPQFKRSSRLRALHASRAAYAQRSCATFAQRAAYFDAKIAAALKQFG